MQSSDYKTGPVVSEFAHITRSALAQKLMEHAKAGKLETVELPFEGDYDAARAKTKSIRRTMARHQYRLYMKVEPTRILLWARHDPTIRTAQYSSFRDRARH